MLVCICVCGGAGGLVGVSTVQMKCCVLSRWKWLVCVRVCVCREEGLVWCVWTSQSSTETPSLHQTTPCYTVHSWQEDVFGEGGDIV